MGHSDEPIQPRSAFLLGSFGGGAMILNRLDYSHGMHGAGVGAALLDRGEHQQAEINLICNIASDLHASRGPGLIMVDGGANIGTHTVQLARWMYGWGYVVAFEAQQRIFYALAGNIALNNLWNAEASLAALGETSGHIQVPVLNPTMPANFGGLSLKPDIVQEPGQPVSFDADKTQRIRLVAIDDLQMPRLDILKLDVEGMEPEALRGAKSTIARCKPVVIAEFTSCGRPAIEKELPGYRFFGVGVAALCIHESDPLASKIKMSGGSAA